MPDAQTQAPATSGTPQHTNLGLALTIISAAQLMVVLDASIVNIALPSIQRALHFSAANLIWVVNGYTLAFGGLLLLGGRTGDLFGRRRMFIIGIGVFTLASFLGGLATTEWWLIAARVLQGMGGAIAAPTALSLIATTFPEGSQRNRAMGVYAAMSGAGGAVGVILGGLLTDYLSWRYVLYVNVPIGLAVIFGTIRVLGETPTRKGGLDLPGALAATGGMTALVYGLIHAASTSWGSTWTAVPLVVGAALLIGFVLIEARSKHPLMPLRLFRNRNRSAAIATMLTIGTAIFSMFYFLTLFIQNVLGYSPIRAGLSFIPFTVVIVVIATTVSRLIFKLGVKPFLMLGTIVAAAGLFWFSHASVNTTYLGGIVGPMCLVAAGMALCFVPLTVTVQAGVQPHETGIASALLNSGQQVGGSLGLASLGTIAATITRNRIGQVFAHYGPGSPVLSRVPQSVANAAVGSHSPAGIAVLRQYQVELAYMHGFAIAFRVGAGILVGAFLIVLGLIWAKPGAPAFASHGAKEGAAAHEGTGAPVIEPAGIG